MKRLFLATSVLVCMTIPPALQADIAILTGGRTLKVASYKAVEASMELHLIGGGILTLPMERIERVIADEVVPKQEQELAKVELPSIFPKRSWRFDEASRPLFSSRYDPIIVAAARKHDVDPALVSAIIKAESDYSPHIVSHKGAQGLMQLMPATAKRFGVTNAFDPEQNIYGGVRYLRWLLKTFQGNPELAVAAYNAGEGNVWKYDGVPPFRETIEYVKRVARPFKPASSASSSTAMVKAGR